MTCKWPIAQGHYQAVRISDDDDSHATLEMSMVEHTIELYVEKDTVSHRFTEVVHQNRIKKDLYHLLIIYISHPLSEGVQQMHLGNCSYPCIYNLIASMHQNKRITFTSNRMKRIPNAL